MVITEKIKILRKKLGSKFKIVISMTVEQLWMMVILEKG